MNCSTAKKSRFDRTRRAQSSRVIFQQVHKVLSGKCHFATTRSSSSASRSCEREVAFRRLLPAFRVLSSSVTASLHFTIIWQHFNHEFVFCHLLAACQGFATTKSRYAIFSYSSLSNQEFTSLSSISW